jgi:colanic acid biosynthesis glycosyl transferase WcaI
MVKKKIILISHNFLPEIIGIGKYNGEMMNWLASQGHECTVVTTFPYYPYWKVQRPYNNLWYKKEYIKTPDNKNTITVYRCPCYIPQNPTGKRRAVQDCTFWLSKLFVILKLIALNRKYDLIVTVAPPFHLAYLGLLLKKLTGGKLVYHVQDLQIEAARDLKLFSNKKVLNKLFKAEKGILNEADYVSSISMGMIKKIEQKVDREVIFFPNWVDTNDFFPIYDRPALKVKWGFKSDDIIFLYSGAIGVKQGLENLLATAECVKDQDHIKFIICSSGPYKDMLLEEAQAKGLKNIIFMPMQPKDKFNEFLNMADVHLVMQKPTAGDLVMPSKLTTILAVGGASVITASKDTALYKIAQEYDFGYIVEPGNRDLLTEKILSINFNGSLQKKRTNARNYAVEYLNIDKVMADFTQKVLA